MQLGRQHARAEWWKARAAAAERALRAERNRNERAARRWTATIAHLEERLERLRRP